MLIIINTSKTPYDYVTDSKCNHEYYEYLAEHNRTNQ